jgi:predicted ATPase
VLQADVQTELLALVGGNPLCAEEYVRMLVDRGLVTGGRIATGPPLPLPETVQGIIAARLDALGADEKALVQDAAVVGRSFWPGALIAFGFEGDGLGDLLHGLERKEFVRRERSSAVAKETQYAFSHVLVRDVAYGQIPRARRGERHRRAAAWLESLGPDRAQDRAEMLAHHYLAALDFDRAAGRDTANLEISARHALRAAAERASALHAPAAAARLYGEALELWPAPDADRDELVFRRGRALLQSGEAGAELVARARDALLRAGRTEVAAEAEVALADDPGRTAAVARRSRRSAAPATSSPARRRRLSRPTSTVASPGS